MVKVSKKINKLQQSHKWYDNKVKEIEKERQTDRSFEHKSLLLKLKKTKLAIKDKINTMLRGDKK